MSRISLCRICEDPGNLVEESVVLILSLYRDDPRIRILVYLVRLGEPASLRKIARNIGYTHKNTAKYLEELVDAGLVDVVYSERNLTLYATSERTRVFEEVLSRNIFNPG